MSVHLLHGRGDPYIGQTTQQARWCIMSGCRAQHLDQQDFDKARQHEITSGPLLSGFLRDQLHHCREPLEAANMDQSRQK